MASDHDIESSHAPEASQALVPAISWKNLSYSVPLKDKTTLKILDHCDGEVFAGEVCAILGPSGCGKTTLLDVLASRVDTNKKGRSLEGEIRIATNRIRYVQQEESLVGVLTARETLHFAARLAGAPLAHVDVLLREMGLDSAADTQVGTIFSKGMSGGQKRRLSIAIELVSDPCLLFLDEPTSGTVPHGSSMHD